MILKSLILLWAATFPFIMVAIVSWLAPMTGLKPKAIDSLIDAMVIFSGVASALLFIFFYIKMILIEYAILVQKLGFFKAYELSRICIGLEKNFIKIYFVFTINYVLFLIIAKALSSFFGVSPQNLFSSLSNLVPMLNDVSLTIMILGSLGLLATNLASGISFGMLYKRFAFTNEFSADFIWKSRV
jgi:hypothetical protein